MLLNAYLIGLALSLVFMQLAGFTKGETTKGILANAAVAFLWPIALPLFIALVIWCMKASKESVMAQMKEWGMLP